MYNAINHILFDGAGVAEKSPQQLGLPNDIILGNGEIIFRSGLNVGNNSPDTAIKFSARSRFTNDGGHGHRDFASFQIFKFGDLTTRRQVSKDFAGSGYKHQTARAMWYNTVCVDDGLVDSKGLNTMGYRGGYNENSFDINDSLWAPGGSNYVGTLLASVINNADYGYVDYDHSPAWDPSKVDYAEREFVYLRTQGGLNDEYAVVFDRVNTVNSISRKFYLLQSPFEPKLIDNSGAELNMAVDNLSQRSRHTRGALGEYFPQFC